MTYKFKYHPDNTIYRNRSLVSSYQEFMTLNPGFPLVEGEFFEYGDTLELINSEGHHLSQDDLKPYENLIAAINNLGE